MIKKRLKRDFYYLCKNDITNFSVQLIVENNAQELLKEQVGPNSFVSKNGMFLYHFGISDYMETYSNKSCAAQMSVMRPLAFATKMENFIFKQVLVQQISMEDKESLAFLKDREAEDRLH